MILRASESLEPVRQLAESQSEGGQGSKFYPPERLVKFWMADKTAESDHLYIKNL